MLKHTELLVDKLNNPDKYDDVNIENIQERINGTYEQHNLNALMKWILNDVVFGIMDMNDKTMKYKLSITPNN